MSRSRRERRSAVAPSARAGPGRARTRARRPRARARRAARRRAPGAEALGDRAQHRQQPLDDDRRQAEAHLVDDEQRGRDTSARPTASICCSPPESRPALRSRHLRSSGSRSSTSSSFAPAADARQPQVLARGQVVEQRAVLRDERDPAPRHAVRRRPAERPRRVEPDGAGQRLEQPGDRGQRGRLARAVRRRAARRPRPRATSGRGRARRRCRCSRRPGRAARAAPRAASGRGRASARPHAWASRPPR